jgi:hypothetical protein
MGKAISRDTRGLAEAMFEELELLRSGDSTPQQARAKSSVANTICTVARLEMDYARFVTSERSSKDDTGMKALPLGGS